jgi:hypothetical protein
VTPTLASSMPASDGLKEQACSSGLGTRPQEAQLVRSRAASPRRPMFLSQPAQTARDCNRIRAATSEVCPNRSKGSRSHSSSSAISMSSPVESSSVQLHRGEAPDPKVDVAAVNPWILRMAGGSGGRLVSRLPSPRVRWSRLGDIRPNDCRSPPSANGQRTPALTLHTGQAPQP